VSDNYEDVYRDHIAADANEAEETEKHLIAGEVMCEICGVWFRPDNLSEENICSIHEEK